jgi:hypothetical protein
MFFCQAWTREAYLYIRETATLIFRPEAGENSVGPAALNMECWWNHVPRLGRRIGLSYFPGVLTYQDSAIGLSR